MATELTRSQRKIIRNALWASAASGVLIGPGTDAAALATIWITGFAALADDAGLQLDEDFVKKIVTTLFQGLVLWYVSGEVAQLILAAVGGVLATLTVATMGLGVVVSAILYFGSNALINVFFTWRFLSASATVMNDASTASEIASNASLSLIMSALRNLDDIGADLTRMLRAMSP